MRGQRHRADAAQRLYATQLVAIVRTVVSPEVRAMIAASPDDRRIQALQAWLTQAAAATPEPS